MLCLFILLFTIQNAIHQRIIEYIFKNYVFYRVSGNQNANNTEFMVLHIWSFGFGKVMEIILKEFVRALY